MLLILLLHHKNDIIKQIKAQLFPFKFQYFSLNGDSPLLITSTTIPKYIII